MPKIEFCYRVRHLPHTWQVTSPDGRWVSTHPDDMTEASFLLRAYTATTLSSGSFARLNAAIRSPEGLSMRLTIEAE